jgi:hypothetical protein
MNDIGELPAASGRAIDQRALIWRRRSLSAYLPIAREQPYRRPAEPDLNIHPAVSIMPLPLRIAALIDQMRASKPAA